MTFKALEFFFICAYLGTLYIPPHALLCMQNPAFILEMIFQSHPNWKVMAE